MNNSLESGSVNLLRDMEDLSLHDTSVVLHSEPGQVLPRDHAHHLVVVIQHQHVPQPQSTKQVEHLWKRR